MPRSINSLPLRGYNLPGVEAANFAFKAANGIDVKEIGFNPLFR
jgi:hypothetical protein